MDCSRRHNRLWGSMIPAVSAWPTNADLIADVARLGYIAGRVLDPTYGRGKLWTKYKPDVLVKNDMFTVGPSWLQGETLFDFRDMPYIDEEFNTVVFDPPYKLNGTPALDDMDNRFGVDVPDTWQGRMKCIVDGLSECARVTARKGHLLVKCMDQVCSGQIRWQTAMARDAISLRAHFGEQWRVVDEFTLIGHAMKQPEGRSQIHAHGRGSTLLVIRREK
jgi:hypothetical protein